MSPRIYVAEQSLNAPHEIANWENDAAMDLYVRATVGNDSNSGVRSSQSLKTLTEAEKRIPYCVNNTVRIHVGAHTGNGYAVPEFRNRHYNAHVAIVGDGAGETAGGVTVLATGIALMGTDTSMVVAAGPLVPDVFVGKTLEITSGVFRGYRRTIVENTAANIYTAAQIFGIVGMGIGGVAPGDTFRIIEPAIRLDMSANSFVHMGSTFGGFGEFFPVAANPPRLARGLNLVNFQLYGNGGARPALIMNRGPLFLYGLDTDPGTIIIINSDGLCCSGLDSNYMPQPLGIAGFPYSGIAPDFGQDWTGYGINGLDACWSRGNGFKGYMTCPANFIIYDGSKVSLNGGRAMSILTNATFNIPAGGGMLESAEKTRLDVIGFGNPGFPGFGDTRFRLMNTNAAFGDALLKAVHADVKVRSLFIDNAAATPGIQSELDSFVNCEDITGAIPGIGIVTRRGGQVRWNGAQVLTGTVGDFSEDNGVTPRLVAALVNESYFVDAVAQSRIYRSDGA